MDTEAGSSASTTPPVWTLDPFDYSKDSRLKPIPLTLGETIVGRYVTPGLEDIGYVSKQHLVFRLTENEDGQIEGTVEWVANGNQMGLVGNAIDGDKVIMKDGTQHAIKVGDEIHLLRTSADRGGKGFKYMYTVEKGCGKLEGCSARRRKYSFDESDSDSDVYGFTYKKTRVETDIELEPEEGPKMPECVDISELPSDDEEEIDNINSSQGSIGGKGKERESDRGGSAHKDETWVHMVGEFTCQICVDLMVESTNVDCGHQFCAGCIEDWLLQKKVTECPVCRKEITMMAPCLTVDTSIEKMVENKKVSEDDAEAYRDRKKLAREARNGVARSMRHVAPPAAAPKKKQTVAQQRAQQVSQQRALEQSRAEVERMKQEVERHKAQAAKAQKEAAELRKAHMAKNQGGGSSSGEQDIYVSD